MNTAIEFNFREKTFYSIALHYIVLYLLKYLVLLRHADRSMV